MQMRDQVEYLHEYEIERRARRLFDAYGQERIRALEPPVPVDDVLEIHLGLSLDLDDLRSLLKLNDVLGATWVNTRQVVIDQSLDPSEDKRSLGRYRFTVAHEIGHWQLHMHYFVSFPGDPPIATMESARARRPSVVCRGSQRRTRIEWQANTFAAFLLMPEAMVLAAWRQRFGHEYRLLVGDHPSGEDEERFRFPGGGQGWWASPTPIRGHLDDVRAAIRDDLGPRFGVSSQAMALRLWKMGLLYGNDAPSLFRSANAT